MTRLLSPAIALTLAASGALAQPKKPAPPPPPPQEAAPPSAGILFPCRSEKEVCFVGVVKDAKLFVLFTNDPKAEEAMGKPLAVAGGDGAPPDLAGNEGRLVMMTGSFDAKAGLSKAEIVDVASPLVAFAIKANAGGGEGPPEPPPPPKKKR